MINYELFYSVNEEIDDYNHHSFIYKDYCNDILKERYSDVLGEVAEDFFNGHDGWECDWPVKIYLYDENKNFICTGKVDVESEPHFYCVEIKNHVD